ncbi:MAG: hypothetical protein ABIQ93_10420 [Saprospiraceae bacterium]
MPYSANFTRILCFLTLLWQIGAWSGCQSPQTSRQLAFYYWQTTFRLSATERHYLDSLHCRILYVKFLDIGRDAGLGDIRPLAQLAMTDTAGLGGRRLVPTVFLTNEVFQNLSAEKTGWLAQKTATALQRITGQCPPGSVGSMYQFDCDWTAGTRAAFFNFLQKIRSYLPPGSQLSATIRLHQYKSPGQTGVPPVDRGMLMLYNTGDLDDPAEENSIFQTDAARRYLDGVPAHYPLPLDVALPIFSWALVFRDEEFWKIIPDPSPTAWADTARFAPAGPQRFRIRQGTFAGGHYLRPDDRLRMEAVEAPLLREAAQMANRAGLADDATVAFFHLDSTTVARYPAATLDSVWQIFRR